MSALSGTEGRPRPGDYWRTPPDLYRTLDAEFHFALDAACEAHNCLAPAGFRADLGECGLLGDWRAAGGGGAVWCNPPYSRVRPWLEKALASRVAAVLLVPADTSTRWWIDCVGNAAAEVRFISGRVRFVRADGSQHRTKRGGGGLTTPSAIVVYRPGVAGPRYSYIDRQGRRLESAHASSRLTYLAVPYSHPDPVVREERFRLANLTAGLLMAAGEHVFSPISHTHPIAEACALPGGWGYWRAYDRAMLERCGRLLILTLPGWEESKGVRGEVEIAVELGIPVQHVDPEGIAGWRLVAGTSGRVGRQPQQAH